MTQRSIMHITKTGEDCYRVVVDDQTTQIDEPDLDGPKLEAMLRRNTLVDVTPEVVLDLLDQQKVGYRMIVSYELSL